MTLDDFRKQSNTVLSVARLLADLTPTEIDNDFVALLNEVVNDTTILERVTAIIEKAKGGSGAGGESGSDIPPGAQAFGIGDIDPGIKAMLRTMLTALINRLLA